MIKLHDSTPWHNQLLQGIKLFSTTMISISFLVGMIGLANLFEAFVSDNIVFKIMFIMMCTSSFSGPDIIKETIRKSRAPVLVIMIALASFLFYNHFYNSTYLEGYKDGLQRAVEIFGDMR